MKQFSQNIRQMIIEDILKLISIKSFTNTVGIRKCQLEIVKIAKKLGFESSLKGNNRVLVIEPKGASNIPELGVLTHLDTVPFNEDEWSHNPLGEIFEDRIFGRGVVDDKSAIILALYAFYLLKNSIRPTWQILVGSCEEGKWLDMQAYLEEGHQLPKFSITIDGDGIQNGCKGYLDLELSFSRNSLSKHNNVTRNISEFYVPNSSNNTIPEKAIAVVNGNKLEASGISAHSSNPQDGKNAIIILAKKIKEIPKLSEFNGFFKLMNILEQSTNAVRLGFSPRPVSYLSQFCGFTVVSPTNCELKNNNLIVNLNFRILPGTSIDEIRRVIRKISFNFDCRFYVRELKEPSYVSPFSKEIIILKEAYQSVLKRTVSPTIANGIGYNAVFPNCVIFGPRFSIEDDEIDTCHSIDENRKIDDLFKFFQMLTIFIKKYIPVSDN